MSYWMNRGVLCLFLNMKFSHWLYFYIGMIILKMYWLWYSAQIMLTFFWVDRLETRYQFVYWIPTGNSDIDVEGTWTWWDGSRSTYTNWPNEEPNGNGNCGGMFSNGTWDDNPCSTRMVSVCRGISWDSFHAMILFHSVSVYEGSNYLDRCKSSWCRMFNHMDYDNSENDKDSLIIIIVIIIIIIICIIIITMIIQRLIVQIIISIALFLYYYHSD